MRTEKMNQRLAVKWTFYHLAHSVGMWPKRKAPEILGIAGASPVTPTSKRPSAKKHPSSFPFSSVDWAKIFPNKLDQSNIDSDIITCQRTEIEWHRLIAKSTTNMFLCMWSKMKAPDFDLGMQVQILPCNILRAIFFMILTFNDCAGSIYQFHCWNYNHTKYHEWGHKWSTLDVLMFCWSIPNLITSRCSNRWLIV